MNTYALCTPQPCSCPVQFIHICQLTSTTLHRRKGQKSWQGKERWPWTPGRAGKNPQCPQKAWQKQAALAQGKEKREGGEAKPSRG